MRINLNLERNVLTNRSLIEYNYLYKRRRSVLKKYTIEEVDDYDKAHAIIVYRGQNVAYVRKHLLLRRHKWWLIDGIYYQVPRPISLVWFLNLKKGIRVTTYCLLAALIVGGATAITYNAITSQPVANIIIDSHYSDKVSINNLHYSYENNLVCNLATINDTWKITDVTVAKGETYLVKLDQFFYSSDSKTLTIKDDVIKTIDGQIVVTPILQ